MRVVGGSNNIEEKKESMQAWLIEEWLIDVD